MDDYETEQRKAAAISVLTNYSQFALVCLGQRVQPHQLRLHLMKEVSGMPTSLNGLKGHVPEKRDEASTSEATSSGHS